MSDPDPPDGSPTSARPPDDLCDMAFSCEIMDDPVVAADGYTYNRREIMLWFAKHNVFSPQHSSSFFVLWMFSHFSTDFAQDK
jgi:hypothetical protein